MKALFPLPILNSKPEPDSSFSNKARAVGENTRHFHKRTPTASGHGVEIVRAVLTNAVVMVLIHQLQIVATAQTWSLLLQWWAQHQVHADVRFGADPIGFLPLHVHTPGTATEVLDRVGLDLQRIGGAVLRKLQFIQRDTEISNGILLPVKETNVLMCLHNFYARCQVTTFQLQVVVWVTWSFLQTKTRL